MVTSRIIALIIGVVAICMVHGGFLLLLRRFGPGPNPVCPGCRYDLRGARSPRCSECGGDLSPARFARAGRRWTTRYRLLAAVGTLGLIPPIWSVGRNVVELHWIADLGQDVFVPGLFKDKGISGALIAGCIALWALLSAHAFYAASRSARRASARLRDVAAAYHAPPGVDRPAPDEPRV
jgi:hypothetical protein